MKIYRLQVNSNKNCECDLYIMKYYAYAYTHEMYNFFLVKFTEFKCGIPSF